MQASNVITRFAPSPTGFLHIGGARTALFNWLYARHCGGRFLIRIEDTDVARSTPEAVEAIFKGLDWLGLKADGDVVFQSKNQARHIEVVQNLLDQGRAYRCFLTPEETEQAKLAAQEAGHALRSPWRDRTPAQAQLQIAHTIRFKGPLDEPLIIHDAVQGDVRFSTKTLDDLVLLRSDGTPTYNLAVVVDDHDMGITHIIRGDDHLNNAARQSLIYQALGWTVPQFAHIPLIHGPDGAKLSKRHGAQAVGDYEDLGYLPQAMRNYLCRLGWSHGDIELFSDEDAIQWFDIADINKAPARLDFAKLGHVNAHWLRLAPTEELVDLVLSRLDETTDQTKTILQRTIPLVIERAQTLIELTGACQFALLTHLPALDDKAKNLLNDENLARLNRLHENVLTLTDWSGAAIDEFMKKFVENEGVSFGKVGPILRAVLCRGLAAPDITKVFLALGRDETLRRLKPALFI